jgi:hypothetical protein
MELGASSRCQYTQVSVRHSPVDLDLPHEYDRLAVRISALLTRFLFCRPSALDDPRLVSDDGQERVGDFLTSSKIVLRSSGSTTPGWSLLDKDG